MFSSTITKVLFTIGVIALLIILSLFIKLPYNISFPGKLLTSYEWVVYKGNNGQLITQLNDRRTGIVKNYSIREFERGDDVSFSTIQNLYFGSGVNQYDTLGYIYSNEIQRQIILLEGQLKITKAKLDLNLAGEKESIVNEAQDNLSYQKRKAEEQRKILARKKALYNSNLISQQEYEIAEGTAALNDIEISIAESQLKSAQTGTKNQQIDLVKQQINAYENEIGVWKSRLMDNKLVSPISGMVTHMSIGDTLFVVSDTSSYIVLVPIKLQEKQFVKFNDMVEIELPFDEGNAEAKLMVIGNSVHYIARSPVVYGTAFVKSNEKELLPGMLVKCSIDCGSISIFEHFKRMMYHNLF